MDTNTKIGSFFFRVRLLGGALFSSKDLSLWKRSHMSRRNEKESSKVRTYYGKSERTLIKNTNALLCLSST